MLALSETADARNQHHRDHEKTICQIRQMRARQKSDRIGAPEGDADDGDIDQHAEGDEELVVALEHPGGLCLAIHDAQRKQPATRAGDVFLILILVLS